MTSVEITHYSASLCITDELQPDIWVNREQLDEKSRCKLCHRMALVDQCVICQIPIKN